MSPRRKTEAAILAAIERAARAKAPCPTNAELAQVAGMSSPATASVAVKRLECAGKLSVERGNFFRVVKVVGSGLTTAGSVSTPPWRDNALRKPNPLRVQQAAAAARSLATKSAEPNSIAARAARDQAALRARRERWLEIEQQRYGLPHRGRLIEDMPA